LDVEHGVRGIALLEDNGTLAMFPDSAAFADFAEKHFGIEDYSRLDRHLNARPIFRG
jgi:hypothetical protein